MQVLDECLSNEMRYDELLVYVSLPLSLAIAFISSSESCTGYGIVGWWGFIHLCVCPAVQGGCGRCPVNVRVATEVQFARYTLVKITFIFFLQLHSQKHRASFMKSAIWKSSTGKSLVNGLKSKLKTELCTTLWAFDFLNPHNSPVFRSNWSLCETKANARRLVTILRFI